MLTLRSQAKKATGGGEKQIRVAMGASQNDDAPEGIILSFSTEIYWKSFKYILAYLYA